MAFKNRIRLPFYVTRPQFPREANIFRRADGSTKVQSVIIRKVFEGETDNLPKEIHERLLIALSHDDVTIEGRYYLGGISLEGDYDIDWTKFLDYPLAKSAFKVQVTPFNYSNDNCQTCEEVSQVVCVDDNIGTVDEDETVTVHPLVNDFICCKPVVISLISYNTNYLDSCIISGNDIIIHAKPSLPDATGVVLLTYRAQCPNGSYDEANVIGDINGTDPAPVCNAPYNLFVQNISDVHVTIGFTIDGGGDTLDHIQWTLYAASDLINPLQTGVASTADLNVVVTGLTPNTAYRFYMQSFCSASMSGAIYIDFTTDPSDAGGTCGQYNVFYSAFPANFGIVTYIDCNGTEQSLFIQGSTSILICALQSSPGAPVELITTGGGDFTITYFGLC